MDHQAVLSAELASHVKRCNDPNCACADFTTAFSTLPEKHPLVLENWLVPDYVKKDSKGHTWVNASISNTSFSWNCLPCSSLAGSAVRRQSKGTYETWISGSFKTGNLIRHQNSPSHMKAVCKLLEIECPETTSVLKAPELSIFVAVFREFVNGRPPREEGYKLKEGTVGYQKAMRILWLIFEAFNDKHRAAFRHSETICIMRDERKMTEHIRFRCTSSDGALSTGFLGQIKLPDPSAIGLNQATNDAMRNICTKWRDMPQFLESKMTPQLDQIAFDKLRANTEAIATDSADNEIAASRDLTVHSNFLTSHPYILRDSAHSARRMLSRGWAADPALHNMCGFLFTWRESLGQLMHHSCLLANMYKECVRDYPSNATCSLFGVLKTAKHRFESQVTPLARIVLNPTAFLQFASRVYKLHKGKKEGSIAKIFLETITYEMLLLAAMMADCGSETLSLLRVLDSEDLTETCAIVDHVDAFLNRVTWLMFEDGCLNADSYTNVMIKWLSEAHHFAVDGRGRAIGGALPSRDTLNQCFAHMRTWVILARDVVAAEFPSFDVVSSFSAFSVIESNNKRITNSVKKKVQRLAQTFKKQNLLQQFNSMIDQARKEFEQTGCTIHEAWMNVVLKYRQMTGSDSVPHLFFVLKRLQTFVPYTSKIEQTFSIVSKMFGNQRLNMCPAMENMTVSLLVNRNIGEADLLKICKSAREMWSEAYGASAGRRQHIESRDDRGVKRQRFDLRCTSDTESLPSERLFKKRLHEQVIAKSQHVNHTATLAAYTPRVWTCTHTREQEFNKKKLDIKRLDANLKGLVLPEETDYHLRTATYAEVERRNKAFKARLRASQKYTDSIHPTRPTIQHHNVFVLDRCWTEELRAKFVANHCRRVTDEIDATVHIMDTVMDCVEPACRRVQWAAALTGAAVCAPDVYLKGKVGPWLQYGRALDVNRILWVSDSIQDASPRLWNLLQSAIATDGSKWLLVDLPGYLAAKMKHSKGRKVIGLCSQTEYDVAVTGSANPVSNLFTPIMLLTFLQQLDPTRSVLV